MRYSERDLQHSYCWITKNIQEYSWIRVAQLNDFYYFKEIYLKFKFILHFVVLFNNTFKIKILI